ncbi:MAG: hypothetical protein ACJARD_000418 [Alphaproteobacteria bacterium]|jgi:hypothetical protein
MKKIINHHLVAITMLVIGVLCLSKSAFAFVPREQLFFNDLTYRAEHIIVFRPFDNKQYKIRAGIGCIMAMFDDLTQDTTIYAQKFGDILEPRGNGDIGLLYINTPYHNVRCKIVDIEAIE